MPGGVAPTRDAEAASRRGRMDRVIVVGERRTNGEDELV